MPRPPTAPASRHAPSRVVVLGDLMVDVVVRPLVPPVAGTDVPGRVELRAGGSAANTARWLARLGVQAALIAAVGRDPSGRALAAAMQAEGVQLHLARLPGVRTGRIGVLVSPDGERTFVADRGAADRLAPEQVRAAWLQGAAVLHLPAYSLLSDPLRLAAERAVGLARTGGTRVSLDLASAGPLLAGGRDVAIALVRSTAPDVLFATEREATAVAPGASLLDLAPLVVLKRGAGGATVLARRPGQPALRLDVPTSPVQATDSTGAGDAFDAGFIVAWLRDPARLRDPAILPDSASLRAAVLAGHRAARRELIRPRPELRLL